MVGDLTKRTHKFLVFICVGVKVLSLSFFENCNIGKVLTKKKYKNDVRISRSSDEYAQINIGSMFSSKVVYLHVRIINERSSEALYTTLANFSTNIS